MKNAPGMYLRAGVCELLRERDFLEKTGISDDDGISTWFFLLCSSLRVEFLNLARKIVQGKSCTEPHNMEIINC